MTNPIDALKIFIKPELHSTLEMPTKARLRPELLRLPASAFGDPDMPVLIVNDPFRGMRRRLQPDMEVRNFGFSPLEGFNFKMLDTLYEGPIAYQAYTNFWTRVSTAGDPHRHFSYGTNFFDCLPMSRNNDMEFFRSLIFADTLDSTARNDPEFRTWGFLAAIWNFLKLKSINDPVAFARYRQLNGGDIWSVEFFRRMWEQEGRFLLGACNSKAVLLGILLAAAGVEPWRQGIFSARYKPENPGEVPSHVYNGVYYGGRWHIVDLLMLPSLYPAMPHVEDNFPWVRNVAHPGEIECDYVHPFSMEQPKHNPVFGMPVMQCPATPLLGCDPFSSEPPETLFAPPTA